MLFLSLLLLLLSLSSLLLYQMCPPVAVRRCRVITLTLVISAEIHCKMDNCLPVLSITCSIYSMVALAEERYR